MQIAVGSHKRAGVGRAAGTRGRAPRTVVLEFVVSKAAVAGVVGPERGIRLRRSEAILAITAPFCAAAVEMVGVAGGFPTPRPAPPFIPLPPPHAHISKA